jgi:hypothetical protein
MRRNVWNVKHRCRVQADLWSTSADQGDHLDLIAVSERPAGVVATPYQLAVYLHGYARRRQLEVDQEVGHGHADSQVTSLTVHRDLHDRQRGITRSQSKRGAQAQLVRLRADQGQALGEYAARLVAPAEAP